MMEGYLSKLKSGLTTTLHSTIGTTVSNLNQLSNLLPGNKITREFEILNDEWTSGGNQLCWKICDAVKKSTNQKASIFLMEKKYLDSYNRKDKELILDSLRKAVQQLTRLRVPSILKVEHPLEESRDCIAFATEPVLCSLANLLGKTDNMSLPIPKKMENYELIDLEIQYGLFQISESISFLHNDVKLLHRNLCPENIIITKRGAWKLFGFEFCAQPNSLDETPFTFPLLNVVNQTKDFPQLLLPNLVYLPYEYYQENEEQRKILLSSDMYQLGFLTFNLFSRTDKSHPLLKPSLSLSQLNQLRIKEVEKLISNYDSTLRRIPENSRFQIKNMLSVDQYARPNIIQYQKLGIFEDVQVRTLQYLDSVFKFDNLEKVKFYKGLPEILALMPKRIKVDRIMGELAKEFIQPDITPFVLPNYLLILKDIDDEKEFTDYCLPQLNPVFQMKEPIQVSIILMQNIELLLLKCKKNQETIKNYILPMICRCFDHNSTEVQDLCLQSVPNICYLIEQTSIKNSLLPKIKKLCLITSDKSMKVKCLLCIGKIITHLDKWIVIDDVINFLPEVNSREAACIMACIGIYQLSLNHEKLGLTKEVICNRALPHMISLSIENSLNTNQFETIMSLIKQMIKNFEDEHKSKLEQMDSMKSQQEMALVSFNRSSHINSQNILKSLNEITYEESANKLSGNTNVLNTNNGGQFNNSNNDSSGNGTGPKQTLNSMTTNNSRQNNFFNDLTSTLTQNSQMTTGNSNVRKQQPDYSHLVNFDLGSNKTTNNKPKAQNSLDSIQAFPTQAKPTLNSSFNQLQLTQFPSNSQFGQYQSSNMMNPTMLSIEASKSQQTNPGQYKLNKSDLDEFLN